MAAGGGAIGIGAIRKGIWDWLFGGPGALNNDAADNGDGQAQPGDGTGTGAGDDAGGYSESGNEGGGAAQDGGDPDEEEHKPGIRRIHGEDALKSGNKSSYDYWSRKSTEEIVESLRPGSEEPLTVKPDGRIFQGNTRTLILEERVYDINSLPREIIP
ncbi:MAG: hypothetical protein M9955_12800 [Rhizobiaceae bacterium]|nr:hypothetical protein [Rhizobiaceae bacterium]